MPGPEPLDGGRVDLRVAAGEPAPERRPRAVVVDRPARCPRGVRPVAARAGRARSPARRSTPTARARRPPTRPAAGSAGRCRRARRRRRASAYAAGPGRPGPGAARRRPPRRPSRRSAAGGTPSRTRGRARPGPPTTSARPSPRRRGRPGRRRGSPARTSPCAARCSGSGRCREGGASDRTRPDGVWNCAAMMPGVPLGATQSTFTSSSGASTVSPSHSLTRCGSPAISKQAREISPVGAGAGVQRLRHRPLDEERQLRVGDQAVDADLAPRQLGAVGQVSVARAPTRGPAVARPPRCRRPPRPTPASRRRAPNAPAPPGRTAPCRTPGGRAPRRPRGRCGPPAAGSCCVSRTAGACPHRRTTSRAVPRCAGLFRPGRQVRRRRRCGPSACRPFSTLSQSRRTRGSASLDVERPIG